MLGALGFRIARKVQEAAVAFRSGYRGEAVKNTAVAAKPMATMQICPSVDSDHLSALRSEQATASIPLVPDLVLDSTWVYYDADLDSLTRISSIEDKEIKLTLSGPLAHAENGKAVVTPSKVIEGYPQCQEDLLASHLLVTEGNPDLSIPLVGTTRFSVSRELYDALKGAQKTRFAYRSHHYLVGEGYSWRYSYDGEIQRDILAPFTYKAIVNGTATDLPALHAMGLLDGNPTQLTVLDDRANPIILDLEIVTLNFALRITKISYPAKKKIEDDLRQEGRAEIYGIYFDFDSDVIRPESEPVLDEIAETLKQNPTWQLSIQGHTDSVGGDAHNLELSKQRAESVKNALTERYALDPTRLSADGFGASRPKAPNDTVEGRALNRRVELVRQ
jgi:outer membrane protein OmpA-like peptidoglycan-associated protein